MTDADDMHVPGIEADPIGTKPIAGVPQHYNASGISIQSQSLKVDPTDQTYVPGNSSPQEQKRKNPGIIHDYRIQTFPGVDYMSAEESQKMLKGRNQEIEKAVKAIMSSNSDAIRRYNMAKKYVEKASEEDRKNPPKKLKRAMAIVKKGVPITEDQAREEAFDRLRHGSGKLST